MAETWRPRCTFPKDLVRPVPLSVDGTGGPTRGQSRSRAWRRTSHGLYVPAGTDTEMVEQRILEIAASLPPTAVITGWAALRVHGAAFFDGTDSSDMSRLPVTVVCAEGQVRPRDGLVVQRGRPPESLVVHGIRVATPERALFDTMRASDVRSATVAMDMAAAGEVTSIRRMRRFLEGKGGWTGVPVVRKALDLADEDSWSPPEARLRLVWILDCGFPRPLSNRVLYSLDGRRLGRPDLFDAEAGVVGEYDGGLHQAKARRRTDARREQDFRDVGLETFKVVAGDLDEEGVVAGRMRAARSRARWLPVADRRWRVGEPEDESLDFRLDKRELEREQHERWRSEVEHRNTV